MISFAPARDSRVLLPIPMPKLLSHCVCHSSMQDFLVLSYISQNVLSSLSRSLFVVLSLAFQNKLTKGTSQRKPVFLGGIYIECKAVKASQILAVSDGACVDPAK